MTTKKATPANRKAHHKLAAAVCLQDLLDCRECGDKEIAHDKADKALVTLLRAIGYGSIADAFERVEKWYA